VNVWICRCVGVARGVRGIREVGMSMVRVGWCIHWVGLGGKTWFLYTDWVYYSTSH